MENQTQIDFGNVTIVEAPKKSFDATEYMGRSVKIEKVLEKQGEHGPFIQVQTEPVEQYEHDGETKYIRASRVFGLFKDANNNIVIYSGSKLHLFLQKMGATSYKDLIGKTVKITVQEGKDNKQFLSFI